VGIIAMLLSIRWGSIVPVLLVERAVLRGRVSLRLVNGGNCDKLEADMYNSGGGSNLKGRNDNGKSDEGELVVELDIMKGLLPTNHTIVEQMLSDYRMRPLSAGEFLWSYYYDTPENFKDGNFRDLVGSFDRRPMIDANILGSVWPDGPWNEREPGNQPIEYGKCWSRLLLLNMLTRF
jgi:hypothetical protein